MTADSLASRVLSWLWLNVQCTTLGEVEMELAEIHLLAEKRNWQNRFIKAYDYEVRTSDQIFGSSSDVRFFVAKENGKELGFIRINNKTSFFKGKIEGEIWNAADAYVKPAYRNMGVLKGMLLDVISNHNVKMCCLVPELYEKHRSYYRELGFVKEVIGNNTGLMWLFHRDAAHLV
jgi:GNAT superfamily N-acetyltransferase